MHSLVGASGYYSYTDYSNIIMEGKNQSNLLKGCFVLQDYEQNRKEMEKDVRRDRDYIQQYLNERKKL